MRRGWVWMLLSLHPALPPGRSEKSSLRFWVRNSHWVENFQKEIRSSYVKEEKVQGMTGKIDVSHGGEQQGPHNAHQSPQHLDEIALKPNPLTQKKRIQ